MPIIEPLPVVEMSQANCDLLRDWASHYGAAVRQPTVCQETTMAKHSTLPENMYHRQCIVLDRPVTFVTRHAWHDRRPWGWIWRQQWRTGRSEGADGVLMEMDQCSKGKLVVPQHFSLAHGPSLEKLLASIIDRYLTGATLSASLLLSICTRRRC